MTPDTAEAPTRPAPPQPRRPADVFMRRLLRVDGPAPARSAAEAETDAQRAFSTSMLVSATRCLLTYVVLPFVAPALSFATGVGPAIGIVVGVVAMVSNVVSMRRFWRADHRWRWAFTAVSTSVMLLLVVPLVGDVANLAG